LKSGKLKTENHSLSAGGEKKQELRTGAPQ